MILQALLAAAAVVWLFSRGYISPSTAQKLLPPAALAGALYLVAGRHFVAGAIVAAAAVLLFVRSRRRPAGVDAGENEARLVLGVGERASRGEIVAAHRRRIAAVHPDLAGGGDAGLASRVNAARDLLLSRLPPAT